MWIKIENGFPWHPKMLLLTSDEKWLAFCGICYASQHLTDGFIPRAALTLLAIGLDDPETKADRLVEVGLWERENTVDWRIHDYLQHQRPSEKVRDDLAHARAGARTRGRAGAGARTPAQDEIREDKSPPVVPPRGGRKRDRERWEKDAAAYAGEHLPRLPRELAVRLVRQWWKYGDGETLAAFVRQWVPEVADQLEPS